MFRLRNIKCLYLKSIRRIKGFLLSDKSKVLNFYSFYFIASAFWLLQTLNNDWNKILYSRAPEVCPIMWCWQQNRLLRLKIKVKDRHGAAELHAGKKFSTNHLNFPLSKTTSSRVKVNWAEIETGNLDS